MLLEYIAEQLKHARYELIDRGTRYYGAIAGLRGVWATGKTLEECRERLSEALQGWLVLRFKKNLPVPKLRMPFPRGTRAQLHV